MPSPAHPSVPKLKAITPLPQDRRVSVVVVGAGVVGLSSSLWLQRAGHAVTIIDPEPPLPGNSYLNSASFGNACTVALGACIPIGTPGILGDVPGMDEPFSALDRRLRESMQREVKQLQASLNLTTIFITHDQEEALVMSDRIAVIDRGTIQQLGTPNEIYYHPQSITVAQFIGESNILEGTETPEGLRTPSGMLLRRASPSTSGRVLIRPEAVRITREPAAGGAANQFKGKIASRTFVGGFTIYQVDVNGGDTLTVRCLADEETMFAASQEVHLSIREADCRP
ncbi:MAG: ABC transporter ATP-binding protein, partial [Hyphomicrobiaceae bacterium]|nr:ABC transporter ATP-binding protein [Hyphomicrobiaceae bacterium]